MTNPRLKTRLAIPGLAVARRSVKGTLALVFLLTLAGKPALAQTVVVSWSAFTSGFSDIPLGNSRLWSITGQTFVGESSGNNTTFSSGFLADTLIRGPFASVAPGATPGVPTRFELSQNYPNPFNPSTIVRYIVPAVTSVKLVIYDLLGREIAVLVNEIKTPGTYSVRFDGSGLASGVYIYRMDAGSFVQSRKLLLLR